MEDGVAYMVMGDGGDISQATQVVTLDSGDGTQQLAIPIIDPETGQETYMIIDPQTAQGLGDGGDQQFVVLDQDSGMTQMIGDDGSGVAQIVTQVEDQIDQNFSSGDGNIMVMLPNGEQGMVINSEGLVQQDKSQQFQYMVTEPEKKAEMFPFNGHTPRTNGGGVVANDMIKVVGIQDKSSTRQHHVSVVKSTGRSSVPSNYDISRHTPPVSNVIRPPRKQSLSTVSDYSQETTSSEVPPGLTGDIFRDTELVEDKVREICRKINMTEQEKEKLRLNLMTRGLDSVEVNVPGAGPFTSNRGRGRGRGSRGRGGLTQPSSNKSIKCDQCGKAFPANVHQSVLVHHVKTQHMTSKPIEKFACDKCEKLLPTATALKYHTCTVERFQCPDCNKIFMQKSTLIEHQAVAHRPRTPIESVKLQEEFQPERPKPNITTLNTEMTNKVVDVKKLVDDWDDDDDEDNSTVKIEVAEVVNNPQTFPSNIGFVPVKKTSAANQEEQIDEAQIVADVDDILNDTDNIMNDVDSILSGKHMTKRKYSEISSNTVALDDEGVIATLLDKKRPTVQCEECYECFEDSEKLAWHRLNDH